jgi:hypothetical protein
VTTENADSPEPDEVDETVVAYATILMLNDLLYELVERDRPLAAALIRRFERTLASEFAKSMPRSSAIIRASIEGLKARK